MNQRDAEHRLACTRLGFFRSPQVALKHKSISTFFVHRADLWSDGRKSVQVSVSILRFAVSLYERRNTLKWFLLGSANDSNNNNSVTFVTVSLLLRLQCQLTCHQIGFFADHLLIILTAQSHDIITGSTIINIYHMVIELSCEREIILFYCAEVRLFHHCWVLSSWRDECFPRARQEKCRRLRWFPIANQLLLLIFQSS